MTSQLGWTQRLVWALTVAAATVAAWWVWLGRDTAYQTDPATGVTSGPYTTGQVAGFVVSLAAIAAVAGWLLGPIVVTPAMTVPLTVAWSAQAAATDETGLWVVGAVLVFAGTAAGTALVSTLAMHTGRRRTPTPA